MEWIVAGLVGFVGGMLFDRWFLYRRELKKETDVAHSDPAAPVVVDEESGRELKPWEVWYARWSPLIMLGTIIVVVISFLITLAGLKADQDQDREFSKNNKSLLECVSEWADDFTGASIPVREASVARDAAVVQLRAAQAKETAANDALTQKFIDLVLHPDETPTPKETAVNREELLQILRKQAAAAELVTEMYNTYSEAENALVVAREKNPLPPKPELSCSSELEE